MKKKSKPRKKFQEDTCQFCGYNPNSATTPGEMTEEEKRMAKNFWPAIPEEEAYVKFLSHREGALTDTLPEETLPYRPLPEPAFIQNPGGFDYNWRGTLFWPGRESGTPDPTLLPSKRGLLAWLKSLLGSS